MTKPKGVGRGGKRQNAGRPRKNAAPAKSIAAPVASTGLRAELTMLASAHDALVDLAKDILKEIMLDATLPTAPRVSAAKALIAGPPGSSAGKKEAAHRAAAVAGAGTDWGDDLDPGLVN